MHAVELKKGDAVQIMVGFHLGRHTIIDRVVTIRTEAERRAGRPGRTVYEVTVDREVLKYNSFSLRKSDVLDALGDL